MKKNIAVVYGGFSAEHDISVRSGKFVASVIDSELFNVFEVLLQKDRWFLPNEDVDIDKSDFSVSINGKKITFDAVVIEIHGNPGENGIFQSYLDLQNIPYTTCSALVSGLTFNKFYCNSLLKNFNILSANSIVIRKDEEYSAKLETFINENSFLFFIKPNEGGSSFGTFKIKSREEVQDAINQAFVHSKEVILEQFIGGRELTCGVYKTDEVKALSLIEIKTKNDFFDYDAKYNSELNEEIIPAPVSIEITQKCKDISVEIYKILNCSGIVRMDYILKDDDLYFLEVNTVPGMTSNSLVPQMFRYDNIDIAKLFTDLINKAIAE